MRLVCSIWDFGSPKRCALFGMNSESEEGAKNQERGSLSWVNLLSERSMSSYKRKGGVKVTDCSPASHRRSSPGGGDVRAGAREKLTRNRSLKTQVC